MTPIQVYMPAGEAREGKLRAAIEADKLGRFQWGGNASDLPGDVRFVYQETFRERCNSIENPDVIGFHRPREYPIGEPKVLDVEIKDFTGDHNSDYVGSILNGHLWNQVTSAEGPYVIVVLGDDHDIQAAIRKAAGHGEKGKRGAFDIEKFSQYSALVDGFEANCEGEHIRIYKLGYNQFPRLLLRARKILEGGNLSGFAPHPAPGERKAVALSILAGDGIGATKAKSILEKFTIQLSPNYDPKKERFCKMEDCDGIGKKLAKRIGENIEVMDRCV